jgi:hypothetical protein
MNQILLKLKNRARIIRTRIIESSLYYYKFAPTTACYTSQTEKWWGSFTNPPETTTHVETPATKRLSDKAHLKRNRNDDVWEMTLHEAFNLLTNYDQRHTNKYAEPCKCLTTCWTTGVRSPAGAKIFPLSSVSRPALGPTQPPVQWVPGGPFPGCKARPRRDADHSPLPSAEVVNE